MLRISVHCTWEHCARSKIDDMLEAEFLKAFYWRNLFGFLSKFWFQRCNQQAIISKGNGLMFNRQQTINHLNQWWSASLLHIWIISWDLNTLRPRQNGRHFPEDIFKWIFLNESVWISINISLKFVPRGPINNIPTLIQVLKNPRPP